MTTTTPTAQTRPSAMDVVWSHLRPVVPRGLQPAPTSMDLMERPLPWVLGIRASWTLPRSEQSPALARAHVQQICRTWRIRTVADDLSLIVSELVTNAVTHGRGEIRLHLEFDDARVWVNVTDEGQSEVVRPQVTSADDESGRGLQIVGALAHRYGVILNEQNTRVWACIKVTHLPATPTLRSNHALTRWTWPLTPEVTDRVYACVADAYAGWGITERQAALLARRAADFAKEVTDGSEQPCVAISARIAGAHATVSAVPAADLVPVHTEDLPPQREYPVPEPTWGSTDTAAGRCKWACVNLLHEGSA
ncbi:ATP-binding protein [Streptomyces sp. tea 10]|nr:ATP-binding protein [Streptomyces sp. tea 10]